MRRLYVSGEVFLSLSADWGKEFRPFGARRAYLNCMIRANDSSTRIMRLSLIKLYATACFEKRRSKLDLGQPPGFF